MRHSDKSAGSVSLAFLRRQEDTKRTTEHTHDTSPTNLRDFRSREAGKRQAKACRHTIDVPSSSLAYIHVRWKGQDGVAMQTYTILCEGERRPSLQTVIELGQEIINHLRRQHHHRRHQCGHRDRRWMSSGRRGCIHLGISTVLACQSLACSLVKSRWKRHGNKFFHGRGAIIT